MQQLFIPLYISTSSLGLIFLKLGSQDGMPLKIANHRLVLNLNFYNSAGIFLYCFSFLIYMYLVSKNDLGYIIPLTAAFVYMVIFAASYFIFKETFTVAKIFGIVFIVGGLVLLNLGK